MNIATIALGYTLPKKNANYATKSNERESRLKIRGNLPVRIVHCWSSLELSGCVAEWPESRE